MHRCTSSLCICIYPGLTVTCQTIDFNPEVFAPFLQDAVTDLVQILAESEALESKRRIAKCLIVLIQRAGTKVS